MAEDPTRDTKQRILDEAERLFADLGFSATSMRGVTTGAGVNLAAVHYHFGSKEALIEAVFARRLGPLNRERLDRLERLDDPSVEAIVEAFVSPALRLARESDTGGPVVMRLLGHAVSQPAVREIFIRQFQDVFERFTAALQAALPALPREEIVWRFLFMVGAMAHTMSLCSDIERLAGMQGTLQNPQALTGRLVAFLTAGLHAALPADVEHA